MVSRPELVMLGEVTRPHGLKGLLRVKSYARSKDSFQEAGIVILRDSSGSLAEFKVRSVVNHKGVLLLSLEGLEGIDQAEQYRGSPVFVRKEALGRPQEDEYFWYQLLGLKVFLESGYYLGKISRIIPTGGTDVFVISQGGKEVMIPAAHEVVREIDLEQGTMTVAPPEGLLELYEV